MTRRLGALLFVAMLGLGGTAVSYQQSGSTVLRSFYQDTSYCLLFTCSPTGCPPTRVALGSFTDPIPSAAKLTSASLTWRTGNDKQFSWQNVPTVSIDLNGVQLGSQQTVYNYASCNPATADFSYFSALYPSGFPQYVRNGQNTLYLTMLTQDSAIVAGDSMVLTLGWELPPPFQFNITDTAPETDRRVILTNLHTGYPYPRYQAAGGQDGRYSWTSLPAETAANSREASQSTCGSWIRQTARRT